MPKFQDLLCVSVAAASADAQSGLLMVVSVAGTTFSLPVLQIHEGQFLFYLFIYWFGKKVKLNRKLVTAVTSRLFIGYKKLRSDFTFIRTWTFHHRTKAQGNISPTQNDTVNNFLSRQHHAWKMEKEVQSIISSPFLLLPFILLFNRLINWCFSC